MNSKNLVALDSPVNMSNPNREGNMTIGDILESDADNELEIKADRQLDCTTLLEALKLAFKTLSDKEKYILLLRFDVIDDIPDTKEEIEKILSGERMVKHG